MAEYPYEVKAPGGQVFKLSTMFGTIQLLKAYYPVENNVPMPHILIKDHKVQIEFDATGQPIVANADGLPEYIIKHIQEAKA